MMKSKMKKKSLGNNESLRSTIPLIDFHRCTVLGQDEAADAICWRWLIKIHANSQWQVPALN